MIVARILVNNLKACTAYHVVWLRLNGPFTCLHLYGFQPYIRNDSSSKKTDFTVSLLTSYGGARDRPYNLRISFEGEKFRGFQNGNCEKLYSFSDF